MKNIITYRERMDANSIWALQDCSSYFERGGSVFDTLRRITKVLDGDGVEFMLTGTLAYFFHGFRRFTDNIDISIFEFERMACIDALRSAGFDCTENSRIIAIDPTTGVESRINPFTSNAGLFRFEHSLIGTHPVISMTELVAMNLRLGLKSTSKRHLADVQDAIKQLRMPLDFIYRIDADVRLSFEKLWDYAQWDRKHHDDQ